MDDGIGQARPYETVRAATAGEFERALLGHPLAAALREGRVGRGHYVAWLRETWHLVRHTTRIYARAASHCGDGRRALRDWFLEQADEENGHDRLCVKDLQKLGLEPQAVLAGPPRAGVWGLITQDWYLAEHAPAALLGSALVSEELGARVAGPVVEALAATSAIPREALGFIRAHGVHDLKHFEDAKRAVDELARPEEIAGIVHARRMAIGHCARVLSDVLEHPAEAPAH